MEKYLISFMALQRSNDLATNINYGDTFLEQSRPLCVDDLQKLRSSLSIDFKTTVGSVAFLNIYKFE